MLEFRLSKETQTTSNKHKQGRSDHRGLIREETNIMKKRWLSLAVAATAAITVLAGCGSKAAETTAAATEAATTEAHLLKQLKAAQKETKAEAAAEAKFLLRKAMTTRFLSVLHRFHMLRS